MQAEEASPLSCRRGDGAIERPQPLAMQADSPFSSRRGDGATRSVRPQLLEQSLLLLHQQSPAITSVATLAPGEMSPGSAFGGLRAPLVFRPQRFSLEELWETETSRAAVSTPYRLQYYFFRSETLVLKRLLEDHGFAPATSPAAANILWCGGHVKADLLLSLNAHQKVNHFPRTVELTRKDYLVRTLGALRERCGSSAYEYLPTTFVLPAEADALFAAMARERSAWIVKPIASSRGRGISLVSQPHQLPVAEDVVVSKYVARPLLVDGYKFDIRLYVAVTSFDPLKAYVFDEGLARFSTERYQPPDSAGSMGNHFIHLTNYSIQKKSASFAQNVDAAADDHGNKWSVSALKRCLARNGVDVSASIPDAVLVPPPSSPTPAQQQRHSPPPHASSPPPNLPRAPPLRLNRFRRSGRA